MQNSKSSPTFSKQKAQSYIDHMYDTSAIASLMQYIAIPNKSRAFDPEWETNHLLEDAAEHIMKWVQSLKIQGLHTEMIKDPGYAPIIFTEIQGQVPGTVFYYGHFDKQPPFEGWMEGTGATLPLLKDGKLYGRGGADDGYSTYATMLAIKALQEQGLLHPRIVMITEGDEQSGDHIDHYIETLKGRIGNPSVIFCLDSGTIDYETFSLTNSLRGVVIANLTVEILKEGIHSGDGSGMVPDTFRIVRMLLDRIEDVKTGNIIQDFQVDVPPHRYKQIYELVQEKGQKLSRFDLLPGATLCNKDTMINCINNWWASQLVVVGADGLPPTAMAGSVLRPKTTVKISMRIPPGLDHEAAGRRLKDILQTNPPYGATIRIENLDTCPGWSAPILQPYLDHAIDEASESVFGTKKVCMGQGGSIPLMNLLQKEWPKANFLISGVLGPQSNAHGPNEFLHIPFVKKLTCFMSFVLHRVSEHLSNQKQAA